MTEPIFARPASTVILVRDGPTGLEMFLVRRHEASGFANRAYVFPGGSVIGADTSDASISLSRSFTPEDAASILNARGDVTPDSAVDCLSYWIAAARELLEEAGVALHDGSRLPSQQEIDTARLRTLQRGDEFADAVWAMDVGLSLGQLVYFSHWRTPVQSPKRYDTRFFITEMPAGQVATHCNIETTDSAWFTPARALAQSEAGELQLVYATRAHIARLLPFESVADALEFARTKQVRCVEAIVKPDKSVHIDPEVVACW
jgi:8-oxo-dGTP pyrophosphatase MutT (NUDIX family)